MGNEISGELVPWKITYYDILTSNCRVKIQNAIKKGKSDLLYIIPRFMKKNDHNDIESRNYIIQQLRSKYSVKSILIPNVIYIYNLPRRNKIYPKSTNL